MSFELVRDPARRMGGAALIRLDMPASGASRVTLRRDEGALCLGPHGWSGADHAFGPYPVEQDRVGAFLRVGPEIVDRMEAYLPVEIALPDLGLRSTLAWPDEILPTPGAFVGGGVGVSAPPKPTAARDLSGVRDTPPAQSGPATGSATPADDAQRTQPEPEPAGEAESVVDPDPIRRDSRRGNPLLWIAPLLLLAAAGGGWWLWSNGAFDPSSGSGQTTTDADAEASEPATTENGQGEVTTEAATSPPVEADRIWMCARDDLAAAEAAGPAALWSVADACASADRALERDALGRLIERGEGEAMRRWGRLLDPWARPQDSPIAADAADAAVNYRKALEAGVEAARADLDALCAALRADGAPMSRPLVKIHCE